VDDSGFAYLKICKDNVQLMKYMVKSYYINDNYDGGENEK
jgi:hypothetical protein